MFQVILGALGVIAGVYCMSLGFSLWRFLSSRSAAAKLTAGMKSGIYVEHGMIIDPETGLVTPQQRPSVQAYRHVA